MNILTIRTDKPISEIGIFNDSNQLDYYTWEAHRQLAETIHLKLKDILDKNDLKLKDIEAMVCYKGPGSFTGLRIGLSVAKALSYSLDIPIIGIEGEDDWIQKGITKILDNKSDKNVIPEYGAPVHITKQKK